MRQPIGPHIPLYIQARLLEWLAANPGASAADLARRSGLTEAQVSLVKNRGERVGWKAATHLGRVFGHRTIGEVDAAARAWWREKGQEPPVSGPKSKTTALRLRDRPEWNDVLAEAMAERVEFDAQDFEEVGKAYDSEIYPRPLNARFVGNMTHPFFVERRKRPKSA